MEPLYHTMERKSRARGEREGKNFLKEVFPRTPFQELS
jgi:hypothetical protein